MCGCLVHWEVGRTLVVFNGSQVAKPGLASAQDCSPSGGGGGGGGELREAVHVPGSSVGPAGCMQHTMVGETLESVNYHAWRILGTMMQGREYSSRPLDARMRNNILF